MYRMLKYQSLHNHTKSSDGTQTHLDVLKSAEEHGFDVIAFTDHDSLPSREIVEQLQAYNGPVKWIIGIEISSSLPIEMGGGPASLFHIVGLFVDPFNKELLAHCEKMQDSRKERMRRIVSGLQENGITITEEDCLAASGGEVVGRGHISRAILSHEENSARLSELAEEMRLAGENDNNVRVAYETMMEEAKTKGEWAYIFPLVLGVEAFIPGIYVDYLYSTDMDESVRLIRDAGGVAILAHYPTVADTISLEDIRSYLEKGRLDGIELCEGVAEDRRNLIPQLVELAEETGCLASIGADAHKPEHFKAFTEFADGRAELSRGIFSNLMEYFYPSDAKVQHIRNVTNLDVE